MTKTTCFLFLSALFLGSPAFARSPRAVPGWEMPEGDGLHAQTASRSVLRPDRGQRVIFDVEGFRQQIAGIAREEGAEFRTPQTEIRVPTPNGGWQRFLLIESPVLAPGLAEKYPEIRSFRGISPEDPTASLRLSISHKGCRIQVLSALGSFYVEPYLAGDAREHLSYYRSDLSPAEVGVQVEGRSLREEKDCFNCEVHAPPKAKALDLSTPPPATAYRTGDRLRNLRLAIAATGEYTAYHGGTVADGLAALNDLVTRITGIYEVEVAVRLTLVANNDQIVYTNAATDPYGADPLDNVQADIDAKIGNANYDIGHVVSTGTGGVAFLGSVYVDGIKASGFTGLTNPVGDPFWVDYVAHEMGHQFGANHTFNATNSGSCSSSARNTSTAYEPGSGSTIMGYAGICGFADNLQTNSDPYFHHVSLDEINAHLTSVGVPAGTATGNTIPENVTAGPNLVIPAQTPFVLTASATDPDGDTLTYCWEQRDLGPAQSLADADNGSSPLFRSFPPTTDPSRTFPRLTELLQNTTPVGERLPVVDRTMRFRVTVRDNRAGGGGVEDAERVLTVDSSSGPFVVTYPNSAVSLASGSHTVTWDVANTATAPVNAPRVSIRLSTDGGLTYPVTLVRDTPNDGTETVTLPPTATTAARIRVEADDHVFFDISNADFEITVPASPSLFAGDVSVTETDTGTQSTSLNVQLTPANLSQTVQVSYQTQDDTAVAGEDYVAASGVLTFTPGQTSATVPLTLLGDTVYEGDEQFTVVLSNPGGALLGNATGVVTILDNEPVPPVITSAASDQAVVGEPYSFQVTASVSPVTFALQGTLPAGLQFDAATGRITGTPVTVGSSSVTFQVSNGSGQDSQLFTLQVVSDPFSAAVDQDGLALTTTGNANWFVQSSVTFDGVDAVQSGDIGNSQVSDLEVELEGPDVIAFQWKVSSEAGYDFLEVLLDGERVLEISGEVDWQQRSVQIPAGTHTVTWRYTKDSAVSEGQDAGWVDQVLVGSLSPVPLVSSAPVAYGQQNAAFLFQVESTGESVSFEAAGLPAGLSINATTGVISGTPTQAQDSNVILTVRNASGSSSSALLLRIGQVASGLATALDQPDWTVFTGGDLPFVSVTNTTSDGVDAAASGAIADDQRSWMAVQVQGPGELRFRWRISTEADYDLGRYKINGVVKATESGEVAWTEVVEQLDAGTQWVEWSFERDAFGAGGFDRIWVDQVSFATPFEIWMTDYATVLQDPQDDPEGDGVVNLLEYAFGLNPLAADATALPRILVNANGQLEVTYTALRPELTYRVQGSYDLQTWSAASVLLSPQTGDILAIDQAPPGPTNSRFLRLEVVDP